jgi:hypothetical protein
MREGKARRAESVRVPECESASNFGSDSILMKFGLCLVLVHRGINAMQQALRPSALVPLGFVVENATCDGATTVIAVRHASRSSPCPGCGTSSGRISDRAGSRCPCAPIHVAGRTRRISSEAAARREQDRTAARNYRDELQSQIDSARTELKAARGLALRENRGIQT